MTTSASALMTTIVYSVKERNPFLHDVLPLGTMKGPALRQGRAVSRRSCSAFRLSATSRPSAHAEETSGLSAFAPIPLVASDSLAVLRGNLAPSGAVIKPPRPSQGCTDTRAGRWCSRTTITWRRGLTIPIWTWTRIRSWCCRTPGLWARPGCRSGGSCRSRRSCWRRACAICCAFRTRA